MRISDWSSDVCSSDLFEGLMFALRDSVAEHRAAPPRSGDANATLAFFEAYFSNFIEGTEFTVDEAAEIVFEGVLHAERPAAAHDVLGRSAERCVGKECVSTLRVRWSRDH